MIPSNDPALADAVLAAAGLTGDAALRAALIERLDITTLTAKQVEDFARLTGMRQHRRTGGPWAVRSST